MSMILDPPTTTTGGALAESLPPTDPSEYLTNASGGQRRVHLTAFGPGGEPRWLDDVEAVVNRLLQLQKGWDGHRARRIDLTAVGGLIDALGLVAGSDTLTPHIILLPNGGLQAEWLVDGTGVEIEVDPAGERLVLATDEAGEVLVEGALRPAGAVRNETQAILQRLTTRVATVG